MAPEIPKHDFVTRFKNKYNDWSNNKTTTYDNDPTINYLCPKTREKREKTAEEDRVETDSSAPTPTIYGFKNEIKSLKHFLLDQKVYKELKTLVVVGEYGVGKTALCKKIFNEDDVKSVYAPRIWVSMHSNETEGKKISVLKKILKCLGVEDDMFNFIHKEARKEFNSNQETGINDGEKAEDKELSALLYALHLNLRWKKYLIVFDDVREEDKWDEKLQDNEEKLKEDKRWGKYLSDGFPKGSGGRVIYTTRDENMNLAKKLVAEEHEIHRLWPLSDSKSVWDIYQAALEEYGEKDPPRNDKKCIEELMNKSRGVPLAVRLMATLLPVFLDTETNSHNGSTNGTDDSANTRTSEENTTTPPPQT